jgi:hypothetical protein
MTFSRWIRLSAAVCAVIWWLVMAGPTAPVSSWQSPLLFQSPLSPLEPPSPDPFTGAVNEMCNELVPCTDQPVTPQPDFSNFIPGVASGEAPEVQAPATPPDLGTVLNYIAVAIVVIGVPLRLYWYMKDRRRKDQT